MFRLYLHTAGGCKGVCGGHEKATTLQMGAWVLKRGPMLYDINGPCEGRYEEGENTSKWM